MSNFKFYINDGDGVVFDFLFGETQKFVDNKLEFRTGKEIAEGLIEKLYVTQKGSFKKLTDKWDVTNDGSELIFTSKEFKAFSSAQFTVNEKENRAEVKGEMLKKKLGGPAVAGEKEVNTLTVTGSAVSTGNLEVTFDDGNKVTKTIAVAKGDTPDAIATKIMAAFNGLADWGVTKTEGTAVLVFTAKVAGVDKEVKVTITNK
ncbi:hypothetical protein FQ087_13385 [Sporosarcina sp. ANT_H38]|uniref:hypothetical protein n=1 Tax=Sporosarcina sp. ANT_H38 TaxID=2597358 RepID=UPI0011F3D6B4|nr:hypothetical protein [Sporosarcina sp. ANT_H38]KAA0955592.1 hypothetical protein FQ087_13385 [Sporosarcina sp. ANT_H38]